MPRRSAEERFAAAQASEQRAKERRLKAQKEVRAVERAKDKRRADLVAKVVQIALARDDEEGHRLRAWVGERFAELPEKDVKPTDHELMSVYTEEAAKRAERRKG